MVFEISCWIVNYFKQIEHVFFVLDARKCGMKSFVLKQNNPTPFNIIFLLL